MSMPDVRGCDGWHTVVVQEKTATSRRRVPLPRHSHAYYARPSCVSDDIRCCWASVAGICLFLDLCTLIHHQTLSWHSSASSALLKKATVNCWQLHPSPPSSLNEGWSGGAIVPVT